MLIDVWKVGNSEGVGYFPYEGTGNLAKAENVVHIGGGDSHNECKAVEGNTPLLARSCYNLSYGAISVCSHHEKYYRKKFPICQEHSGYFVRKNFPSQNCQLGNFETRTNMTVGQRIREIRKALKLTQREFAQQLSLTEKSIRDYESDRRSPPDKTLRLISQTFGVSYEWLKEGKGEMWKKEGEDVPEWWKERLKSIEPKDMELLKELIELLESLNEEEKEFLRLLLKKQAEKKKGGS